MSLNRPLFAQARWGRFLRTSDRTLPTLERAEMKNRSEIWLSVLEDLGDTCSVSTLEDARYLRSRVSAEGDSFFTITLPQFAKDLERSLAEGELSAAQFKGFGRRRIEVSVKLTPDSPMTKFKKLSWGVPLFLSGFTRRLFMEPNEIQEYVNIVSPVDTQKVTEDYYFPYIEDQPPCILLAPSSEEEADAMADAIFAVRQLCGLFSKEKAPAPAKAERKAIDRYVEVDAELDLPL